MERKHAASVFRAFVVVSKHMENAVHKEKNDFVAKCVPERERLPARLRHTNNDLTLNLLALPFKWERENVCDAPLSTPLRVEAFHLRVSDIGDRESSVSTQAQGTGYFAAHASQNDFL